jgi:hypothetical protein
MVEKLEIFGCFRMEFPYSEVISGLEYIDCEKVKTEMRFYRVNAEFQTFFHQDDLECFMMWRYEFVLVGQLPNHFFRSFFNGLCVHAKLDCLKPVFIQINVIPLLLFAIRKINVQSNPIGLDFFVVKFIETN